MAPSARSNALYDAIVAPCAVDPLCPQDTLLMKQVQRFSVPYLMDQGDELLREAVALYMTRKVKWSTEEKSKLAAVFKGVKLARHKALTHGEVPDYLVQLVDATNYMQASRWAYAKVHRLVPTLSVDNALQTVGNISSHVGEDIIAKALVDAEAKGVTDAAPSLLTRLVRIHPSTVLIQTISPVFYVNQGDEYLCEAATVYARQNGWCDHEKVLLSKVFKEAEQARAQVVGSYSFDLVKTLPARAYVDRAKRAYEFVKLLTPKLSMDEVLNTMDAIVAMKEEDIYGSEEDTVLEDAAAGHAKSA